MASTSTKAIEIPCCLCGTMILPNAANQCSTCLAQDIDLKSILSRGPGGGDIIIHQCRQCRRFQRTEKAFDYMEPESPELLALCLKHIPALAANAVPKLNLADAMWVWTEPHSMRHRVRLTVRTEVQNVTIQQRIMVELHNRWKQCGDCNREFTNRTWHAIVQLRQRRQDDGISKGLVLLEMALARNAQVRRHVLRLETTKQGFDFYFLSLQHAQAFASYLARVAPMRIKTSKKLVSTDVKSNTANLKHSVACDMVPLCRDDLVMVHKSANKGLLSGRLCLVTKMSSVVHLVDASPKRNSSTANIFADVGAETFYRAGGEKTYKFLSSSKRMTRFIVLDVELCDDNHHGTNDQVYKGPNSGVDKYALADVEVVRESDFGNNDETFHCVTHLGNLLQVGDTVLGYDMASSVLTGGAEWEIDHGFNSSFIMPDVVLVKKIQGVEKQPEPKEEKEPNQRAKSSVSKKREKRRKREEKKQKNLAEHLGRMGFLETSEVNQQQMDKMLYEDPDLAEDLHDAERELAAVEEPASKEGVVESEDNVTEECPTQGNGPSESGHATA